MNKTVLITGGTGLVGTRLTEMLRQKGYEVNYLSRGKDAAQGVKTFQWDINRGFIEPGAIEQADYIINLAGAGVAEGRWTTERRKEILESRMLSTRLLGEKLKILPHQVKAFINASAVGIYGADTHDAWMTEQSPAGTDFLAQVVKAWEQEAMEIAKTGLRVVKIRIGIVLSDRGGALEKLAMPVKLMVGAPIGSGKQYMSWIHIDDLCAMFIKAIEDEHMQGVYNGVAPNPVTNQQMTKLIGKVLHRPVILPNVPGFVLKMAMGEMSNIALGGNRVSADAMLKSGFRFKFDQPEAALTNLLKKH